jgi:hypothetical protein
MGFRMWRLLVCYWRGHIWPEGEFPTWTVRACGRCGRREILDEIVLYRAGEAVSTRRYWVPYTEAGE